MTTETSAVGIGISSELPTQPAIPEAYVPKHAALVVEEGSPALAPEVVSGDVVSTLREEMRVAVADIEWRLAQQYALMRRQETGIVDQITVEDINDSKHRITGYTLTNNTPTGGITWAALHVVFKGVDYTIANGTLTAAQKYAWFVKPASGTTATLVVGAALPTLGPDDALIFVNNGGVGISVLEASITPVVGAGSVTSASLAPDVSSLLSSMQADLLTAQSTADGAVVTFFQDAAPWADGTTQDVSKVGDVWYDSNDGGAFRWSGAAGTPANTWVRIADTDTAAIAAKVNTKITTYVAPNGTPPAAPSGGFTTGDLWMVTDQGNKFKRWSGTAWADITLGDAAIASGISAAKISGTLATGNIPVLDAATKLSGVAPTSVIPALDAATKITGTLNAAQVPVLDAATKINGTLNAAQVPVLDAATKLSGVANAAQIPTLDLATKTTGTLQASKVGAGVAGAALGSATGTVGSGQIATNAVGQAQIAPGSVQPQNINAAFHILY